jgi:hypothetical protein
MMDMKKSLVGDASIVGVSVMIFESSPSQIGCDYLEEAFSNNRADAITNLPKTMPFGRLKNEPIGKALKSPAFSRRNDP